MESKDKIFELPDVTNFVIQKAPLVLALCQIRYSGVVGLATNDVINFQKSLEAEFPITTQGQEFEFELIGDPSLQPSRKIISNVYQFSDVNDIWRVVLTQNYLALETRKYKKFDDFVAKLEFILDKLVEYIRPSLGERIGLRYIDEIRPKHTNWSEVIRKELLGPLCVPEIINKAKKISSLQKLSLSMRDNISINFQHGVIPTGTTVRPLANENILDESFYVLDIDVFQDFPMPNYFQMVPSEICERIALYHKIEDQLFLWSLTSGYLEQLGVKNYD